MQTGKLVVLGSINADHILKVEHFPRPGETLTGQGYQVAFGGKGANQAVAAGRSGADIAFIACVGADDIGERIEPSWPVMGSIYTPWSASMAKAPAWH